MVYATLRLPNCHPKNPICVLIPQKGINVYMLGQYSDNRANRPDIIVQNKGTKEAKIIEIGITSDIGIVTNTHRKTVKYADF